MSELKESVAAVLVEQSKRGQFLPKLFGAKYIESEARIYQLADKFNPPSAERSSEWDFYQCSNGAGFMAPKSPQKMKIFVVENFTDTEVSAEAFGIICTLFVLSFLVSECFDLDAGRQLEQSKAAFEIINAKYVSLRDYAVTHPEWQKISAAID